jgi:hypothetical protein
MAPDPQPRERSFWGRLVVMGVFWGVFAYGVIALYVSIATTLYGRPPAGGGDDVAKVRQEQWCLRTLVGLRDELEAEVNHELARAFSTAEVPPARFPAFEERWQSDFEDAASRCDTRVDPVMADAYALLRTMHHEYAESATRILHTRADTDRQLAEKIKALTGQLATSR